MPNLLSLLPLQMTKKEDILFATIRHPHSYGFKNQIDQGSDLFFHFD